MSKEYSISTVFKAKDGVTSKIKKMTYSTKDFANGIQNLQDRVRGLKEVEKIIKGSFAYTAIEKTAQAIKTGFNTTYMEFAEWDKGIRTVYTLLSKDEITKFGGTIKELSKDGIKAGLAVEDVNSALFNAVSAMGMSQQTLDVYKKSLVLAKGGAADLSTSLSGMMAVMNAWGPEVTDATTVANAFFTAQKNGVTTVQELAESIGSVAPIAKSMGLSVEETMASVAVLTKGGMSTDMATTGLRATLTALAKPSKEAEETMRKFGVPVGIAEVRAKGLTYTLQKLIELQEKSPNSISKAIPNVKALTGVLAMDERKMKEVHKTLGMIQNDIKNGTGLNEAFGIMSNSDSSALARASGELKLAFIEIGEVAAPYLLPLVQKFTKFVRLVGKLIPHLKILFDIGKGIWHIFRDMYNGIVSFCNFAKKNLVGTIFALSGAIVFATYAIGNFKLQMALAKAEGGLFAIFLRTGLGGALKTFATNAITCFSNINKAMLKGLFSPTGLIIAGVALLIGGVILLWKNWDKVSAALKKFWNWTKDIGSKFVDFFKTHFTDVILTALGPFGILLRGLDKLGVIKIPQIELNSKNNAQTIATQNNYRPNGTHSLNGKIGVAVTLNNRTQTPAEAGVTILKGDNLSLATS